MPSPEKTRLQAMSLPTDRFNSLLETMQTLIQKYKCSQNLRVSDSRDSL